MADDTVLLGNTGGSQGGITPGHKSKLPGFLQQIFANLTNPSVTLPNGQQEYGDPSQLAQAASRTLPSVDAMLGPDVLNPAPVSQEPLPSQIQTPTFSQAVGTGEGAAVNPALTTKGKVLATVLQIARGGLAGYAQSRIGNPREGYPYANPGAGFAAAEQLPFIQALRQQELKKQQLENQFQQMSLSQMNMPVKMNDGTSLPLWQAMQQGKYDEVQASIAQKKSETQKNRYVSPRNGGLYDTQTQTFAPGTEPQAKPENLDQLIAAATQKAMSEGRDPRQDPTVKQLTATKLSTNASAVKPDSAEQQFIDEYRRKSPNASMSEILRAYSNATKDNTARNEARSDKSYQYHSAQLDKLQSPIEQAVSRFSRLQDTLNQATPQADALVAPELLTVMAGGQGSGLRMNEAEIQRIVGGRSAWESLKAAANKWQADPSKALSITPAQRQQVRQLMDAVYGKLQAKQQLLDGARQQLISTDDPNEHKRILARVRQQLSATDQGGGHAQAAPSGSNAPPPGAKVRDYTQVGR